MEDRPFPVAAEAVPYLIDAVQEACKDDEIDPNDHVIFQAFVLPVLEDHRDEGFDRKLMLDKGFGFLMGLIPNLHENFGATLPPAHFGLLAKAFHRWALERALERVDFTPSEHYEENLRRIDPSLDLVKRIRPHRQFPPPKP